MVTAEVFYAPAMRTLSALVLLAVLTACGGGGDEAAEPADPTSTTTTPPPPPRLKVAYDACDPGPSYELADGGGTIILTNVDYRGYNVLRCLFKEMDVPKAIQSQFDSTNALMGQLDAEFEGFEMTWNYHPDNGINMTIVDTKVG